MNVKEIDCGSGYIILMDFCYDSLIIGLHKRRKTSLPTELLSVSQEWGLPGIHIAGVACGDT